MLHNFRKVTKFLYRGSSPSPVDVVMLKQKFGIKKIVSLDYLSGKKIDKITKALGINHITIPIDISKSSLINLFKYDLKKLFLEDGPTFVHCLHGKDRTGFVIALIKCKYLGVDPEDALAEARSLGFGIGVNPKIISLYEKLIRSCKHNKDSNNADIVSNERDHIDDHSKSQGSFAPFDQTKYRANDEVYLSINDQSPTRENYNKYKNPDKKSEEDIIPIVGIYNNDAGIHGAGPAEPVGGFIND